jgi:2'-5' RNA ligase
MNETDGMKALNSTCLRELERFRGIRRLHNHWSQPAGHPAYFWYLTFENSMQLHCLARECQKAINFPYYDLTPVNDLHLTIDRVAFDGDITHSRLADIEAAAKRACRKLPSFEVTIGALGGTAGAIGFTAFPAQPVQALRDTLRAATLSVFPEAPVTRSDFHPHVTIAYANSDAPAAEAITAVESLNPIARVDVTISEGTLVLLERRRRSYSWRVVSRIPLNR